MPVSGGCSRSAGGNCACATCHVKLSPEFAAAVPPMAEEEDDMLEDADGRVGASRLSCQIVLGPEHDGLAAEIADG